MLSLKPLSYALVLLALCLLPLPRAWGQSATATLSGTVVDEQSNVVPDVKITLQNDATSRTRDVTSNDSGRFTCRSCRPGLTR